MCYKLAPALNRSIVKNLTNLWGYRVTNYHPHLTLSPNQLPLPAGEGWGEGLVLQINSRA